jgi:hypothetical protein
VATEARGIGCGVVDDAEARAGVAGVGKVGFDVTRAACETEGGKNAGGAGEVAAVGKGAVEVATAAAEEGSAGVPAEGVEKGADGQEAIVPEVAWVAATTGKTGEVVARGVYAARKTSAANEEGESVAPRDVGIAVAIEEAT